MSRAAERAQRTELKRQIKHAKGVLKELAKSRKASLKTIGAECREMKKHVRARVKAWRRLQAEIAKAAHYGAKHKAAADCAAAQRKAIAEAGTKAEGVRAALAIHAQHLRDFKTKPKNRQRSSAAERAAGRRAEKESEVYSAIAANLEGEWLDTFERFKHRDDFQRAIKRAQRPGSNISPAEAVIEFIAEHKDVINDHRRAIEVDAEREWTAHMQELQRLHDAGEPAPVSWDEAWKAGDPIPF